MSLSKTFTRKGAIASLLLAAPAALADSSSYGQNAGATADRLLNSDWYHSDAGLWYVNNAVVWWNSANLLTAVVGTMALDGGQKDQHIAVVDQIYNNAAASNPHFSKVRSLDDSRWEKRYVARSPQDIRARMRRSLNKREPQDFTNGFYDDEGWWALAWLDSYDLTGDIHYLNTAIDIWNDMNNGHSDKCPGGIWWDKKHTYVNAIANELFIAVSAGIATRVGDNVKNTYLDAAKNSWSWFQGTGMINGDNLINDGVGDDCKNNNGGIFTYNQGVILGGLVDLSKATGDGSYLDTATNIANAATKTGGQLTDANGILHDGCDKNNGCGNDGDQFKGVFMRNLKKLQQARPNDSWKGFLQTNAKSLWEKDLADDNGSISLGTNWAGPYYTATAITQGSALDAVNAALAVS